MFNIVGQLIYSVHVYETHIGSDPSYYKLEPSLIVVSAPLIPLCDRKQGKTITLNA